MNPRPDFEAMTWKCPCCGQMRTDKYIKVATHDMGTIFGHETGVMFINCKYCVDMPGCKEKAVNREWVLNHWFGHLKDKKISGTIEGELIKKE